MSTTTRVCTGCGVERPSTDYYERARSSCRFCETAKKIAAYRANPAKRRRNTLISLARRRAAVRVADEHPDTFDAYLSEERAKLGVE